MTAREAALRDELAARRGRLVEGAAWDEELGDLLRRVDSALSRLAAPPERLCSVCHDPIGADSLAASSSLSICLECLSADERRSLERDLERAHRVQRALLPPVDLRHAGWRGGWLWEPKGAVSGDHVDFVPPRRPEEPAHLLLGDVAGKGVAASLLQSHLHALFRSLLAPGDDLGRLLAAANRRFHAATGARSYATLVAARLHADGTVELANAGHPRPLVADRRGVRPVEGSGVPLGLFEEAEYESRSLKLTEGDTLLLYTDGWTEAESRRGEFGVGRAAAALRSASDLPLPDLLAACRDEMTAYLGGGERQDDVTLLALRRERP
ncbi:MAG: PP2C family protein-serine/threonine phosphatase [Thermoanaerobaculia bacterium]|nr:PP2C family protein-serine/threonine phosphatase [Thermoanaerobaculia bacterium]